MRRAGASGRGGCWPASGGSRGTRCRHQPLPDRGAQTPPRMETVEDKQGVKWRHKNALQTSVEPLRRPAMGADATQQLRGRRPSARGLHDGKRTAWVTRSINGNLCWYAFKLNFYISSKSSGS